MTDQSQRTDELLKRVPPHSIEAERSLLGAMMIVPSVADDVAVFLRPEHFYKEAHATIYDTILDLRNRGQPHDIVLLKTELERKGKLEAVGGSVALAEIVSSVPSAANAEHYATIVKDRALLRALIRVSAEVQRDAFESQDRTEEILDRAERRLFDVTQKRITSQAFALGDVLKETFDRIAALKKGGDLGGITSGFADLDEHTHGFHKGELTIVAARPSMGKCVAAGTEILLEDGSVVTIDEAVRRREARLLTLRDDLRFEVTSPSAFVDDGVKPVFRVTTRLGRVIETTATHPFLTVEGWRPLAELAPGVRIGLPRRLPVFGDRRMRPCEVKLVAYLIGDGGLTGTCPIFTNTDRALSDDFREAVSEFGGVRANRVRGGGARAPSFRVSTDRAALRIERGTFAARLRRLLAKSGKTARDVARSVGVSPASLTHWTRGKTAPEPDTFARLCTALGVQREELAPGGVDRFRKNAKNALVSWLGELGLMGRGSASKFVPACVFTLERRQLALFLNRLFATDGWIAILRTGQVQVGYASTSERLARQVQHLLLRFGIVASLRKRSVRYRDERRACWQLDVTDARAIATFLDDIGIFGKDETAALARRALARRRYQTNRDLVPVEVWESVRARKGGEPWAALARRAGIAGFSNMHVGVRAPTRERLERLGVALADERLLALATSDVTWDPIVSIEALGPKQVYDLTVPETHNFVANDVCVHNTSFALNLLRNIGMMGGRAGVFFSLEMPRSQVAANLLCSVARVDSHRLRGGYLSREEENSLLDAAELLEKQRIFIDDQPWLTTMELRAKARRLHAQEKIEVIVIDYLQLMTGSGPSKDESRQQEVSEISRTLKAVARELSIPVIALAQLSRKVEDRPDHKPRMSDLRESGALEQDADLVLLLHREEYYKPDKEEAKNRAQIIIAKNRNGPTGDVELAFFKHFMRFENLSR